MNNPDFTVYVVDDDPGVLKAVARLLRAAGHHVATFSSARRFLDQHDPSVPGCLVLDLAMPDLGGLELQQLLAGAGETLPIIFLTGRGDVSSTVRAMKQGAADFLTKPVERAQLLQAVCAAALRERANRQCQQEIGDIRRRLANLTPREYEVFEHVISGKLNKQTAADIGAAEKTVKVHRARVMEKMNVESVAQLVRLADRAGIASPLVQS
ncbi:MAG TPA: response regulator [Tepidisphaeraceae bacterium]|jgi:FixJ family two-component response regulator